MKIRKTIISIFALLLCSAAVLSCSMEPMMDFEESAPSQNGRNIVITGSVIDKDTNIPLEDITITFKAYPQNDADATPVSTETVHTDNKGIFFINTYGSSEHLLCIVTAEDKEDRYESFTRQIIVDWTGPSFDGHVFAINECNFYLIPKK